MNEASSKMLTDITKALKVLNDEVTIVKIKLPELISDDTRERLEQVVTHFKAESMKDAGNYVLCSCIYDIYRPISAGYKQAALFNDIGFLILCDIYDDICDRYFAILVTDIGRDVVGYLVRNNEYIIMKPPDEE